MTKHEIRGRLNEALSAWRYRKIRRQGGQSHALNRVKPMAVTPEAVVLIEQVIANGGSLNAAIARANISKQAYYNWLVLNPTFVDQLENLKTYAETRAEHTVVKAIGYDAELALKYLERVKPDKYSLKGTTVNIGMAFDGIVLDKPKQVANLPDNHTLEISTEVHKPSLQEPKQ